MTPTTWFLLVLAGIGGGLTGSIAGIASLVSYPALLAAGLPPVTANVTNAVALLANAAGAVSASRKELVGQLPRIWLLAPFAVAGGTAGALLLLTTPAESFEKAVPVLIGVAGLVVLIRRPPRELAEEGRRRTGRRSSLGLAAAIALTGVYGGYFGAAAGVLMLAAILLITGDTVPRGNALRNVLLGAANGTAALGYAVLADVEWAAALPLAVGLFVGGRLGPRIVRRTNPTVLRMVIAVLALGLAVSLAWQAYR